MTVDLKKQYFMMSFQFNKTKAEDFGLIQSGENPEIYICPRDNSQWIEKTMFDFGWGNEFGYMRLPELGVQDLWELLANSPLADNVHGAAQILLTEYPDLLAEKLLCILKDPNLKNTSQLRSILGNLKLTEGINRSKTTGKSGSEIAGDIIKWQWLKEKADELIRPYAKSPEQISKELDQMYRSYLDEQKKKK